MIKARSRFRLLLISWTIENRARISEIGGIVITTSQTYVHYKHNASIIVVVIKYENGIRLYKKLKINYLSCFLAINFFI